MLNSDRQRTSQIAGMIGIVVNIFLCAMKLFLGFITNSIALISDGFNNLTDIFNAIVVFVGYRFSSKPADHKHPYGHGRLEYMLSQGIAVMIMIVGVTLLRTSIQRLLNPEDILRNSYVLIVLIISLIIKLLLAYYYDRKYHETNMEPLKAQKVDSLADSASIAVIILGYVITPFTDLPIDSIIGLIVSLLIIYSGFEIFKDMTSILLGRPIDDKVSDEINEMIRNSDSVLGVHDLMIHTYGQEHVYGTADVELSGDLSLIDAHNIIDALEEKIYEQFKVEMTLHADPVVHNRKMNEYSRKLRETLKQFDSELDFHDLGYNSSTEQYHVDIEVKEGIKIDEEIVSQAIRELFGSNSVIIKFDRTFE